jgi:hypothetical protein
LTQFFGIVALRVLRALRGEAKCWPLILPDPAKLF